MSKIERPDGATIHYEVSGEGFPILMLAPGGVSSRIEAWANEPFDPVQVLSRQFTVITMDQRHAGQSIAPRIPFDYEQTVADQLAVLDALGFDEVLVYGAEIGCVHAWKLAREAPSRIAAVMAQRPIGRCDSNEYGTFYGPFDATFRLARGEGISAVIDAALAQPRFDVAPEGGPFAQRISVDEEFREEFRKTRVENYITQTIRFRDGIWPARSRYFSVPEGWMREFPAPLYVLPGNGEMDPRSLALQICEQAPDARLHDFDWGSLAARPDTVAAITRFLSDHTPQ